jgi:hypothetical protein
MGLFERAVLGQDTGETMKSDIHLNWTYTKLQLLFHREQSASSLEISMRLILLEELTGSCDIWETQRCVLKDSSLLGCDTLSIA